MWEGAYIINRGNWINSNDGWHTLHTAMKCIICMPQTRGQRPEEVTFVKAENRKWWAWTLQGRPVA